MRSSRRHHAIPVAARFHQTGELARRTAVVQGTYWLVSGLWGALHRPSFEAVTGPKRDYWLARTVAWLVGIGGAAIGSAALQRRLTPEIAFLAAGGAAALAGIDAYYASRGRIRKVYLVDAAAHALLLAAWLRGRRGLQAEKGTRV